MIQPCSNEGLILTTSAASTGALDQVASRLGWPAVIEANARCLNERLGFTKPSCALFWLDGQEYVKSTARLLEWTRTRHTDVRCLVVAIDLPKEVEPVLRSAGAHYYLPAKEAAAVWQAVRAIVSEDGSPPWPPPDVGTSSAEPLDRLPNT